MFAEEQRREQRYTVRMRAYAFLGEHGYACEILDLSIHGCRISVVSGKELSGVVDIHVPGERVHKAAEILWRRGNQYGLRFVTASSAAPKPPQP